MKVPGTRGRPVNVKVGDKFWITSTDYSNTTHCQIDRFGKGTICNGYYIDNKSVDQLFEVVE